MMKFSCVLSPEGGVTWPEIEEASRALEAMGFDALWTTDNLSSAQSDWSAGPSLEALSVLSAMATVTSKVKIGCMCVSNTYRHPVLLAKMAATIDIISGGRYIFGIGAGWSQQEHASYDIPFKPIAERMDRLEETIQVYKLLCGAEKPVDFKGKYFKLENAPFNPKPIQRPHPPVLIAGIGEKRTLRIVAEHGDAMNIFGSPERTAHLLSVLEQHCRDVGRDSNEIEKTVYVQLVPPERTDEWNKYLEHLAATAPNLLERGHGQGMIGNAEAMKEWIQARADLGIDHVVLNFRAPYPLETLRDFSQQVMPHFR